MGNTLGAAEWNTNVLQQGNWTQEVLLGTNADKIPGSAMSSTLALPGTLAVASTISTTANGGPPTGGPESLVISGNKSGGNAEINFYNTFNTAGAGFDFWVFNGGAYSQALAISTAGLLTGAGFFRSTEITITAGATATIAHGLVTRPSFVFGLWCPNSGGGITEKFVVGTNAAAATPYFDTVGGTGMDATNIRVVNGAATTSLVIVNAIK